MKANLKILSIGVSLVLLPLVIIFPAASGQSGYAQAADPLIDREGRTLTVTINGKPTSTMAPRDIVDSEGVKPYTVRWSTDQPKGPLCLKLETHDERLGKPERIDVLIHEIRSDKPNQRWKNYSTVPSTTEGLADFTGEKGFCPKEYTLTERLRYPELPPGDYVVLVSYWGVGNWDRQEILLHIR